MSDISYMVSGVGLGQGSRAPIWLCSFYPPWAILLMAGHLMSCLLRVFLMEIVSASSIVYVWLLRKALLPIDVLCHMWL